MPINVWGGGGHNGETIFFEFFHVSDHLEQFEWLLFLCGTINYLDRFDFSKKIKFLFS